MKFFLNAFRSICPQGTIRDCIFLHRKKNCFIKKSTKYHRSYLSQIYLGIFQGTVLFNFGKDTVLMM